MGLQLALLLIGLPPVPDRDRRCDHRSEKASNTRDEGRRDTSIEIHMRMIAQDGPAVRALPTPPVPNSNSAEHPRVEGASLVVESRTRNQDGSDHRVRHATVAAVMAPADIYVIPPADLSTDRTVDVLLRDPHTDQWVPVSVRVRSSDMLGPSAVLTGAEHEVAVASCHVAVGRVTQGVLDVLRVGGWI